MIEASNVRKNFGARTVVGGVSFSVGKGEVLGFLGPNGAGKSTTMRMITGFLPLSAGKITIGGYDIEENPVEAKQLFGYLPENAPAYQDMTVAGFLDFSASIRRLSGKKKADAIARAVKLCHLENVLQQTIDTLSKGYRHRVGFAQAILHDPPVEMSRTKAIIVSTHILEEVEAICTRVIIIDRGKLVFNGTPRELQEKAPYGHRLRLTVCASDDAPVRAMLEKLPQVRKAELLGKQEKTVSLAVYPAGSEKDFVSAVKKALDEHKWEFCELYLEHGRLDEVFRSLTTSDAVEGKEGAA